MPLLQSNPAYDNAQRMTRVDSPLGRRCYFTYDASSNLAKKRLGNGVTCYYAFDEAERLTKLRYFASGGGGLAYFDYRRDIAGRIVKLARENNLAVYYDYDAIDRLSRELWLRRSTGAQIYAFSYVYDAANNRTRMRREAAAGVETESAYYVYATDNSLTKRRVQAPPSTFTNTYYRYDANGALIRALEGASATYFEYGQHQLVTKITPPAGNPWNFYYDGRLNRYKIDKGGTTTYYLWEGLNQLEERDAGGNLLARYTHGYAPIYGIGSVVEAERHSSTTAYFQYPVLDHRGTAYQILDTSQNTQISYALDAFGRQLSTPGGANPNISNDLIYQTNWLTLTIGGKRYGVSRYRIYDFETGTFLQRDFLPKLNRYRAFSINPVLQVDSDGLEEYPDRSGTGQGDRPRGPDWVYDGSQESEIPQENGLRASFIDPGAYLEAGKVIHWIIAALYRSKHPKAGPNSIFTNKEIGTIVKEGWNIMIVRNRRRPDIAHVHRQVPCDTQIYEVKPKGHEGAGNSQAKDYVDILKDISRNFAGGKFKPDLGAIWPEGDIPIILCPVHLELIVHGAQKGVITYFLRRYRCGKGEGSTFALQPAWIKVLEEIELSSAIEADPRAYMDTAPPLRPPNMLEMLSGYLPGVSPELQTSDGGFRYGSATSSSRNQTSRTVQPRTPNLTK